MFRSLIVCGLAAALSQSATLAQVKVFSGDEDRKVTRIFYYTQDEDSFTAEGQFSVDYASPKWKDAYEDNEAFDEQTRGKRWRLGSGKWTTLDTNVELDFNGTKVAPGSYYCVVERTKDDKIYLVLLDPAEMRKHKLDAGQADETKGGKKIELTWTRDNEKAKDMAIKLTADSEKPEKVTFVFAWGPHKCTAPITAKVGKASE